MDIATILWSSQLHACVCVTHQKAQKMFQIPYILLLINQRFGLSGLRGLPWLHGYSKDDRNVAMQMSLLKVSEEIDLTKEATPHCKDFQKNLFSTVS